MPLDTTLAGLRKGPRNVRVTLSRELQSQMQRVTSLKKALDGELDEGAARPRDDLLVLAPDHHDRRPDPADRHRDRAEPRLLVGAAVQDLLPGAGQGEAMRAGEVIGRGISFPPRLGPDGRLAWSAGEQNVREAIQVILMTELGERLRRPDFGAGLTGYLFEPNTVTTRRQIQDRIVKALAMWEPRIEVESVVVEAAATTPTPRSPPSSTAWSRPAPRKP